MSIRISDLNEVTSLQNDDYVAVDGDTSGTRKFKATDLGYNISSDIAQAYSASSTYSIGEYCLYENVLYRCNTTISSAEAWNASHWTQVNVGDELYNKVDKVSGKGLSTNDFTDALKTKLDGIEAGAEVNDVTSVAGKTGAVTLDADDVAYDDTDTYASGTVGNEICSLKEDLSTKAEVDGYYEEMTVGDAEQLVATDYVENEQPYFFRPTGGTADVGNRLYLDKVVGGTVAWNQLYNQNSWSVYEGTATISVSDGVLTITPSSSSVAVAQYFNYTNGHKYLGTADIKASEGGVISTTYGTSHLFYFPNGIPTNWTRCSQIVSPPTSGTAYFGLKIASGASDATYSIRNWMCFDLTQMFGSTIADYAYNLEQSTAGSGIAWLKANGFDLTSEYHAYNTGELESVEGVSSHDTVGFNQWDEEWENGYYDVSGLPVTDANYVRSKNDSPIRILPNMEYCLTILDWHSIAPSMNFVDILFYDAQMSYLSRVIFNRSGGNSQTFTTPINATYAKFFLTDYYGSTYNNDICINLSHSGYRNGEYEPYVKRTYALDSDLTLRGIPKLSDANTIYYDGDEYNYDGTVKRKYDIVDLGTLNWIRYEDASGNYPNLFKANIPTIMPVVGNVIVTNILCQKYYPHATSANVGLGGRAEIAVNNNKTLYISDPAYTSASDFKTAMNGVYLVYELAEPTADTADAYQQIQICDDFGTEEFVTTGLVPVGTETRYPANLRDKLQHLPSPANSDGRYVIQQTDKDMVLVADTSPSRLDAVEAKLPTAPTTDGTYKLTVTVADGTPAYSWESEA